MTKRIIAGFAAAAFVLAASAGPALAQGEFKVPFPFKAGGLKLSSGDYWVGPGVDGKLVLRHGSSGKESAVPVLERRPQPSPPPEEPELLFHVVGNFEPSYTEYVTEFILAEVRLPGSEVYVLAATKGARQERTIKGRAVEKED